MTFFPEENTVEALQAVMFQAAIRLVYPDQKFHKGWREAWSKVFRLLNKRRGEEKVQKVLAWYCDNLGKPGVQIFHSGTAFRDNFDIIEKIMSEREDKPIVSENIQRWANDLLTQFQFPQEIVSALPSILQTTANRWDQFYTKMEDWVREHPDMTRCVAFLQHVMSWNLVLFPQHWGEYLGRKYGGLKMFTGVPLKLAWKASSPAFKESFWDKWSQDYCTNPHAFDDLLERLTTDEQAS